MSRNASLTKGKALTITDSNECYEKLESTSNDTSKFEEVNVNKKHTQSLLKKRSIAYYVRKYFKGYDEQY